jgi:hypothetical protein
VFKRTSHRRTGPTEPHSDGLSPRFQLLSPKPKEMSLCIFVTVDQSFNKPDTSLQCAGQTLEVCALEVETKILLKYISFVQSPLSKL